MAGRELSPCISYSEMSCICNHERVELGSRFCTYWWVSPLSASILACGAVRLAGYLPVPFGLSAAAQHIPGLASFCRLVSLVPHRQSRAERSGPEESRGEVGKRRNSLPVYILYGSWNFWNYGLPAWKKESPFSSRAGSCSIPLTSLAVRFGQRADYPVVIATANRKYPTAGKAWGFVPVFAGSFLAWVRTLCPKLGQKIQREPRPPFTLAPLYDLLTVYCTNSLW